ncbi:RNA polymerase sigma factor for flagellar operon FliA [Aequitasia blattaphilus]|uniref:FliA/WhiG family RNA polymerase sigma factor n=1 Tax=Aequitasia blattaphilus TaxID=2949332 RepID=A0ABT1E9M0_9FIRM|nr:FliA/WhiG family RNA polymerase sigma factor [Aequitasia blattaphilus]MCP1102524.1 FliA/WhiG family RNA polymerase sigma factor [Aequitasia blattaphilus]MCR8615164.1 FliA/WhiG family RNA polymerase sigma factor [Aequitasia blattaphilus]
MLELSNEEVFALYRRTGNLELKQDLTMRYLYIVRSIAIQMRDVYAGFSQLEDIINEGVLVLMGAIDRYDDSKNAKFETYLSRRIRGMVIDLARKQDWVPRSVRKKLRDIELVGNAFYSENGRMPTTQELAELMEIEPDKLVSIMGNTNLSAILSLDMMMEEKEEQHSRTQIVSNNASEQPEESFLKGEMKEILKSGILSLKESEQLVISLYYEQELNMKQIAEVIGVSEPRVSQIHGKAIEKLQKYMAGTKQVRREYVSGVL